MTTTTDTRPALTTYSTLPLHMLSAVWDMYTEAFEPLRKLAAQRHVMFHDEFVELMTDPTVTKILAHDHAGPAGLAVVTNQLKSVPLIEPEYFAAREPELYERGHIWYTVFVCVRQAKPRPPADTFARLITEVAQPIVPVRGVCFMDYAICKLEMGLPDAANRILRRTCSEEAVAEEVDAQTFWAYYPGGRPA